MSDAFRFADTDNGKTWLWVALVSTASLVLSFSLACAVPLAAFAALAGLHMRKGAGLALVAAAWLVNQIVGFTCLAYPLDASTVAWGLALLGSAVVAMGAARLARGLTRSYAAALLAGFVAAFVGYEGTIYLSHFALGGGWSLAMLGATVMLHKGSVPSASWLALHDGALFAAAVAGALSGSF